MKPRLLSGTLKKSPKSVLLLGPRQVGKSTLISSLNPDLRLNLNDDATYLDFKSNPSELKERLEQGSYKSIFIDEIQRHPSLLNTIQTILDSPDGRKLKFYLSGSSARKLRRGQANLLPGRIFAYELGPLCAAELDYKLDVKRALKFGCLPEPYLEADDDIAQKLLSTYSGVYLREEIQAEALTRNLDGFSRFIIAASEASGLALDFSKLAKQAKIERKICSRFYEILEDTLIANRLEVFDKTAADIVKRPKFYFFDTGVLNGLLGNFTASDDRKGLLFEHLVVNQVLASAKARDKQIKTTYFRTRAGYEVDLIVEMDGQTFAIEIKSGPVDRGDAERLEHFKTYAKKLSGLFLVSPQTADRKLGSVTACSLMTFLKTIGL
jgi:predicted AAA+ superfamily ATPase